MRCLLLPASLAILFLTLLTGAALAESLEVVHSNSTLCTMEVSPGGVEEASVEATITGTWQFSSRENCMDVWMTPCDGGLPGYECPPNPAGQPCNTSFCYDVISLSWADLYVCE